MIEIPANVRIAATLRAGSVFYFREDTHDSPDSHYFVVLNRDPVNDTVLVLVNATSNVIAARRRAGQYPDTLVELGPADYADFTKPSAFDGGSVTVRTIAELVSKLDSGELTLRPVYMSERLVEQLRNAVLASPTVDRKLKQLIS